MDDRLLAHARGIGGQLHIYPTTVRITRRGVVGFLSGKGDCEFPLEHITAIRFRPARFLRGFIQFAFAGSIEPVHGHWMPERDPDTVVFRPWRQKDFVRAKETVERLMERARAEKKVKKGAVGLELEKLGQLKADGVLSEAEFVAFKSKLLER